jgi:hypothetical protein
LAELLAVATQIDVQWQQFLRPFRCVVISSEPKELNEFVALDVHLRRPLG